MTSRKYVVIIIVLLYMFVVPNFVLWHLVIKDGFTQRDLIRLGGSDTNGPLTPNVQYSKHHTELSEYIKSGKHESFDVITMGDSFSNGGGRAYYQDYLEDRYGIKTLNMRFQNHCLQDLYILLQSGMLDELQPRAIILESVERAVQGRLGYREVKSDEITPKYAKKIFMNVYDKPEPKKLYEGFMPPLAMNASMRFIYNKLYHIFYPEKLSPEVYVNELGRDFFTNPGRENILQFYYEDLDYITKPLNAVMVNRNLNNAARILREKNIQLVFFAGVDQYDLFYPYVINKRGRPENKFFPEMRKVSPKDYVFIDTMKIFREALERGEQDIYWFGDTHWSWKGMQLFCDELVKYFNWLN